VLILTETLLNNKQKQKAGFTWRLGLLPLGRHPQRRQPGGRGVVIAIKKHLADLGRPSAHRQGRHGARAAHYLNLQFTPTRHHRVYAPAGNSSRTRMTASRLALAHAEADQTEAAAKGRRQCICSPATGTPCWPQPTAPAAEMAPQDDAHTAFVLTGAHSLDAHNPARPTLSAQCLRTANATPAAA
jgi:hypothetical protein